MASQRPLNGPCFFSASMAYCEQVGVNRQEGEGGKRTTAEVVADNVYFGESKRRDGGDTSRPAAPSASAPAHRGSYGGYDNVPQGGSAFSELDDDDGDLPF